MPSSRNLSNSNLFESTITSHDAERECGSEVYTLRWACALTGFFFIIEILGGYVAGSLAIMSDAAHLLSDLAGFMISLIAISLAKLPATARLSFGFARAEVLGAFVSILFIWALTIVLVFFAFRRLFNPTPVNGPLMLLLGVVGLIVNLTQGLVLGHSHSHLHSHGHSHDDEHDHHTHEQSHDHHDIKYGSTDIESNFNSNHHHNEHDHDHTHEIQHNSNHSQLSDNANEQSESNKESWMNFIMGNKIESINVRAAYIHVLGDALQNVGVIVAAFVIIFFPHLSIVDPICTLLFAVIVVFTTTSLAQEALLVLMEGTPPSVRLKDIWKELEEISGVERVGDLHAWSISRSQSALSVHLYVTVSADSHDILKETMKVLDSKFGIRHATVQINCVETECCKPEVHFENKQCFGIEN